MLLEDQISYLLGGIQVVYIEELQPVLTLEEYYSLLDVFYNRLLKSRVPFHPRSLHGLQMILNSDRYAPSLHELGHFNIPILCDPANLQWFILTKAQQAREKMKRKEECCTSWSGPPVSTGQGGVVLHMSRGWGDRTIYSNIIDLCHLLMKVLKTLSSALSGLLCGPNFTEAVVERGPLWPHRGEALPGWPWLDKEEVEQTWVEHALEPSFLNTPATAT
ncbi:hypothetical protein CB1_000140001 [Camelus ferus]|nr:hypothetical protein CB1_000140001 [Camelus ferus]